MPLNLFTSNRLEALAGQLAESLRHPPELPLTPETIVVQSKGMERWLSLEIARRNGVCANIAFPFPKAFVCQAYRQVADLPEQPPFAPEVLTWKIMQALPLLVDRPEFTSLRSYLGGDSRDLKRFQLSEKIAGLFDQYLIFRPDIINEWDEGRNRLAAEFRHSEWQAVLWRTISDGCRGLHHAALRDLFINKVQNGCALERLPGRVSVFGISTLPPYYIEIFKALAERIQINFYYLNPCREYWEYAYSKKQLAGFAARGFSEQDCFFDSGNSLLGSMGGSGREFFSLILDAVGEAGRDLFEEPAGDTLLGKIQSDILNLVDRGKQGRADSFVPPEDRSVQIHSCHSPMREIEVLYDNLLQLFDDHPDLLPHDVVVMMPEVSAYAPLIHAVFGSPENESTRIPYTIADTCLRGSSEIAEAFLSILTLDDQRFSSAAVLDILQTEAVHKKFQLTEADLITIRHWARQAGICWGTDGPYKRALGLPDFHENTWRFGLDRMLLGYAMPESGRGALFSGILPFGEIEGESAGILGRFTRFAEALFEQTGALKQDWAPADWAQKLENILNLFFAADEKSEPALMAIRELLTENGLAGLAERAGFEERVSLKVILSYLSRRLESAAAPHGFLSTGVTFCTLLPMRSIPFRVVCLLGINDGEYPRSEQKAGFNLMESRKRLCDRSKRFEDRYIFLEAVLSARENLIISYQGQHPKDNTEIPPSVLVCELCDYLLQAFESSGGDSILEQVITKHPLQPFSPRYFEANGRLFSYSEQNMLAGAEAAVQKQAEAPFFAGPLPAPPADDWKTIGLDQLSRFYRNPAEFLTRNRLCAALRLEEPVGPEECEPFLLDGLQQYRLRQMLLDGCLAGEDPAAFPERARASGTLPHGPPGNAELFVQQLEAQRMAADITGHTAGRAPDCLEIQIDFDAPEIRLTGTLSRLFPAGQLFYRPAALRAGDRLQAWIHHLALNACGARKSGNQTVLIGRNDRIAFPEIEMSRAGEMLKCLAALFLEGLITPLCFFPEASGAYAEAVLNNKTEADALKKAAGRWAPPPHYAGRGEVDDIYLRTCFGESPPDSEAFKRTAVRVYGPMLEVLAED